ncbi:MAG: hypothetical protein P8099_09780 [Gemmatimonadota bacterium]
MRTHNLPLILATVGFVACVDQPTTVELTPAAWAPSNALDRQVPAVGRIAYRVTGDFVSPQHSWSFFGPMTIRNLDAWVDRDGNSGGSYDVVLEWAGSEDPPLVSHEQVVCVSVDPGTRQAWIGSGRPDANWGTHYSILQMMDRSPAAMSETARENSGHADLFTGRTSPPWEPGSGPDFCRLQPDLGQMWVEVPDADPLPPTVMFPIDPGGDLHIQIAGPRN